MSLIKHEIRKIIGNKLLWWIFFVFLLLNASLAWYTACKSEAAQIPNEMIKQFFYEYSENPTEISNYYLEIQEFNDKQRELFIQAMQSGNYDFEPQQLSNIYSSKEDYSDQELFDKLFQTIQKIQDYPFVIEQIIKSADNNLSTFIDRDIPKNSFSYGYQQKVIELYSENHNQVDIIMEHVYGWDEYFSYNLDSIFIFILSLLFVCNIYGNDKMNGFVFIMRCSKNGRVKTIIAKIIVSAFFSSFCTILFKMVSFIVYGICIGYSSPNNLIQALDVFYISPYLITIMEYLLISILLAVFTYVVFSEIILTIFIILKRDLFVYIIGIGIVILNFILYVFPYSDPNNFLKNVNMISSATGTRLFSRYRACDLFNQVAGCIPCILWLYMVLLIICIGISLISSSSRMDTIPVLSKRTVNFNYNRYISEDSKSNYKHSCHSYSVSLFLSELYKLFISSRLLPLVLIVIIFKVVYVYQTNQEVYSINDDIYQEYMTVLEGELTNDSLEYITQERVKIDETLSQKQSMQNQYISGSISFEDYNKYLTEYNYALSHNDVLESVEKHAQYLRMHEIETDTKGWFVYDTGWKKIFMCNVDWFSYLICLLLFSYFISSEYESQTSNYSFKNLLSVTKHGRLRTFLIKLTIVTIITIMLMLIMISIDIIAITNRYALPGSNAPLCSIELFENTKYNVTITEFTGLLLLYRVFAALSFSCFVMFLTICMKKVLPALSGVILLTLSPMLLSSLGVEYVDRIDYTRFLRGTPLFVNGSEWVFLIIIYGLLLIAGLHAYREWCNQKG